MDFVIKLLKLKDPITLETFNSIIVICNKLSKDYRIPRSITFNRDK